MKYIDSFKVFEYSVIKPTDMDGLIDRLIHDNPLNIEDANIIANDYGVDIVTYDQFIESIDDEMRSGVPPSNQYMFGALSGINFAVMNKFTNSINLVVSYPEFIQFLIHISPLDLKQLIKSILGHESIHKQQYDKMGNLPNVYVVDSPVTNPTGYLGHHTEIMAYAYSIVDELKRIENKTKEEVLVIIQKGNGHRMLEQYYKLFDKSDKVIKKLNKYLYLYCNMLFE